MKKYLLFLLIAFAGLFLFACEDNKQVNIEDDLDNGKHNTQTEKCVVSFYLDEELLFESKVDKNTKVTCPTNPEIEEAIFDGWFTEDDVKWDFNTLINNDLSLFGKYHYEENNNVAYEIYGEDEVFLGYREQLRLVKTPLDANETYFWRSSNEDIAKVDQNGLVTGCGKGTATIMIVDEKEKIKTTFEMKVAVCELPIALNMGGYEIVIMNSPSSLTDDDPFLERYSKLDKLFKQKAWREVEELYNCKIKVVSYPEEAPWGEKRVKWLEDNAEENQSKADLAVISSNYIPELAKTNSIIDVTSFYKAYGRKQMDLALKEAGTYNEKLYAATTGKTITENNVDLGLYYNYGMLKRLGLDDPATLFNEDKWNYTRFKAWVLEAQTKIGEGKFVLGGHPYYFYYGMTNAAGVKLADNVLKESNVLTDAPRNAMNLLKELADEGCICDNVTWSESPSLTEADWFNGGVLMITSTLWNMQSNSRWTKEQLEWEDKPEYGYVPFPYPDDVKKEDTRIAVSMVSTYVFLSGRNYSNDVNLETIYSAVTEMFLRTHKYQEEDEAFDSQKATYDFLKRTIDNEASLEAMLYFDSSHTFFDPAHAIYGSAAATILRNPAIDVIFGNKEYDEAFGEVAETFEKDLLDFYG